MWDSRWISLAFLPAISQGLVRYVVPSAAKSVGPSGGIQSMTLVVTITSAAVASKPSGVVSSANR